MMRRGTFRQKDVARLLKGARAFSLHAVRSLNVVVQLAKSVVDTWSKILTQKGVTGADKLMSLAQALDGR